ncbi:MAG: hypothetical protein KDD59_05580 [Bdellovibrionales bacterium]|nr:hypothetical protein [Bdellovibrionales bacterium]
MVRYGALVRLLFSMFFIASTSCRLGDNRIYGVIRSDSLPSTPTTPLVVAAAPAQMGVGTTNNIAPSGGTPPYTYEVVAGQATVDSNGTVSLNWGLGDVQIRITDSSGNEQFWNTEVTGAKLHPDVVIGGDLDTYYTCAATNKVYFIGDVYTDGINELFESDLNGGNFRKLNQTLAPGQSVLQFSLSPDCSHITYSADDNGDGSRDVFTLDLSGGTPVNVSALTGTVSTFPRFADSGAKVVFLAQYSGPLKSVVMAAVVGDDDSAYVLNGPLASDNPGVDNIFMLPDDQTVAYWGTQDDNANKELFTVSINGGAYTNTTAPGTGDWVFFTGYSAGGNRLVYGSSQPVTNCYLYGATAGIQGAIDLTSPSVNYASQVDFSCSQFKISSDGNTVIYFGKESPSNQFALYKSSTTSTGSTRLTQLETVPSSYSVNSYAYSRDQSHAYFVGKLSGETIGQLYKVPLAGGPSTKLTNYASGTGVTSFQESVDQTKIVYKFNTGSGQHLYSMDVDGGSNTPLMSSGDVGQLQITSSNRVIFSHRPSTSGSYDLYSVNLDGSDIKKISGDATSGGGMQWGTEFTVSADGLKVVYKSDQEVDEQYEIYVTGAK